MWQCLLLLGKINSIQYPHEYTCTGYQHANTPFAQAPLPTAPKLALAQPNPPAISNGLFQPAAFGPTFTFPDMPPLQQQGAPVTIDYTYDPLNRLTEANYSTGAYYHYTYDSVGMIRVISDVVA